MKYTFTLAALTATLASAMQLEANLLSAIKLGAAQQGSTPIIVKEALTASGEDQDLNNQAFINQNNSRFLYEKTFNGN